MAATVQVSESNGAVETVTDGISNMNFGSADVPNLVPVNHPLAIPTAGTSNSFAKWFRFHLVALGGSTQIDTLKVWKSSGAYVTGEALGSNTTAQTPVVNGALIATYGHKTNGQGSGVVAPMPYNGDGGTILGFAWASDPVLTSVPANLNLSIAGSDAGSLTAAGYSNYAVFGMSYTNASPSGAVNQKVFTWQYNET